MAWTSFGANKAAGDGISAAELITYLKDNLEALKAHDAATSGQHGIHASNYIAGADAAGMHLEGHRSDETGGSHGDFDMTFTWTNSYTTLTAVIHSIERMNAGGFISCERLTATSTTGCTLRAHVDGEGDPEYFPPIRGHVIALGVD